MVLGAGGVFVFGGVGIERAGLADQVQGEVGEGEFFLEHRSMAGPFRQAMAKDQGVVGAAQGIENARFFDDGDRGCGHDYMWPTSSGTS